MTQGQRWPCNTGPAQTQAHEARKRGFQRALHAVLGWKDSHHFPHLCSTQHKRPSPEPAVVLAALAASLAPSQPCVLLGKYTAGEA